MRFSAAIRYCSLGALALLVATLAVSGSDKLDQDQDVRPSGRGIGSREHRGEPGNPNRPRLARLLRSGFGNGIYYHGGPLMLGATNVHIIWYGNWGNNTALNILPDLAGNIGGSSYFNINTTYHDGANRYAANAVNLASQAFDSYSHGNTLSDADIQAIVAAQNPTDTNGVYFVFTSADVKESSGFCSAYCGWHTNAAINGLDIKYSFVGNPDQCPSACSVQTKSPNNNAGADGMASIFAHELEESVTDPNGDAWYDRQGNENADKCAWTFGQTYTVANGSYANMRLGGRDYLIQQNWVNASGGYCAKQY